VKPGHGADAGRDSEAQGEEVMAAPEPKGYEQVLRELTPEEFARVDAALTKQGNIEALLNWVRTAPPDKKTKREEMVCYVIRRQTERDVMTSAEIAAHHQTAAATATVDATESARRSAAAAERSADEAKTANATADKALKVARYNTLWTWGAFAVALVALLISLLK
jgi:hypothetical protein